MGWKKKKKNYRKTENNIRCYCLSTSWVLCSRLHPCTMDNNNLQNKSCLGVVSLYASSQKQQADDAIMNQKAGHSGLAREPHHHHHCLGRRLACTFDMSTFHGETQVVTTVWPFVCVRRKRGEPFALCRHLINSCEQNNAVDQQPFLKNWTWFDQCCPPHIRWII